MASRQGEQPIDEQTRDKVFAELKTMNGNNMCIDCEKKNTKWASIHLGILLCMDCAGKHRQYGVATSFIKSTNLDVWNQKQILYMQKGGNNRCLQFLQKRGVITNTNRTIEYRSPIVQQYKQLLTEEVEVELAGGKKPTKTEQAKVAKDFFDDVENTTEEKKIEIPNAESVEQPESKPKGKKNKKKIGAKQINLQGFEGLAFDGGVTTEERNKIVHEYEKQKGVPVTTNGPSQETSEPVAPVPKVEEPKELSEEEVKAKMEELKKQGNLTAISSDEFKDTSIDNAILKQNLNKFSGSSSISSSALFNKEEQESSGSRAMENIKDMMSNAGGKFFGQIASYWKK